MRCPKCRKHKAYVTNTRHLADETYRKRICPRCGYEFYTFEAVDDGDGVRVLMQRIQKNEQQAARRNKSTRSVGVRKGG